MKKSLAYLYFSQSTAASTLAVTRSRNVLASKMHAFGYDLVGLCCDVENEEKTRPELEKLLDNLDDRKFDTICILGISHISRDPAKLLDVIKKLNAHGVHLVDMSCNYELTAPNLAMKLSMMALTSFYNSAFEREEEMDEQGDDYDYEEEAHERLDLETDAMLKYLDFINHYPSSEEAAEANKEGIKITVGDHCLTLPLNENNYNAIYDLISKLRETL